MFVELIFRQKVFQTYTTSVKKIFISFKKPELREANDILYRIDLNLGVAHLGGGRRFVACFRSLCGSWNDWICVFKVFALSRNLLQKLHWKFNEWLHFKCSFNNATLAKLK